MSDSSPIWVRSEPSTDAQVIGHCKSCGKDHNGPVQIGLISHPDGDIIVAVLVADETQEHHILEAASLASLVQAFEMKRQQSNPAEPENPGGSDDPDAR